MARKGLSIIIPTLNESSLVKPLIKAIVQAFIRTSYKYEIIVIDDHSTDQTARIVKACSRYYPVTFYPKTGKKGKGYSVMQGFALSQYEFVAVLDADMEESIEFLPRLFRLATRHGYACGQVMPRESTKKLSLGSCVGPKIFRSEIFAYLDLRSVRAWGIERLLEVTATNLGYKGYRLELPLAHSHRQKGLATHITRLLELSLTRIRLRFRRPVFSFLSKKHTMLGSGVIFDQKKYITHSTLPPESSAIRTFSPWQTTILVLLASLLAVGLVAVPRLTMVIITSLLSFVYLLDVFFNFYVTLKSLHFPPEIKILPRELAALKDTTLPRYTVLCPLYKEARVLPHFVRAMSKLDYPKNKLEVLLLLEADDQATIKAARSLHLPDYFRILIVPTGLPKTKPKACNYGLSHARGEYIVIYDAEDKPDPLQLKKAYLSFRKLGSQTVCLQAKLNYYNPHDNLLTRLFTAEYSLWFDVILPGLQSINTTIPLGGTSNHFRKSVLHELHGWDPFNVTEDADLGSRLFGAGYQTAIIDSTTLEEANGNFRNWLRQRSRWLKGYMQTYLVHMRHPRALFRTQGIHALLFQLIVGGKIAFVLINPFLWLMTISYFVLYPLVGPAIEAIYPPIVFYMALFSLLFGNFLSLYNYMIGVVKRGHWNLVKYVYLIPLYWLGISYAAGLALTQLFFKPHYWEKTIHGLHLDKQNLRAADNLKKADLLRSRARRVQKLADLVTTSFSAGGVMVLAAIFGNFMNFLYNAYLSRNLDLVAFGNISLFGSFFYFSSVPVSALSRSTTHQTGYLLGKYGYAVKRFWSGLNGRVLRYAIVLMLLWLLVSPFLQTFFRVDNLTPFFLFAPVWILSIYSSVSGGFLSGNFLFGTLAISAVVESLAKFGFAVLLVELGLSGYVYSATALSLVFVLAVEFGRVARIPEQKQSIKLSASDISFPVKFFWSSILTTLTKVTYLSLDIVLAKHFLSPSAAGAYSYLALAGKMVFYLGSMFSQFLIPYVSRDLGKGKHPRQSFLRLLSLVALVHLVGVIVFGLFGSFTAPLLWGENSQMIIRYLPLYTIAMSLFSLTSFVITYHQLRGRYLFPVLGLVLGLLQVAGMFLEHSSLGELVAVVGISGVISFVVVLLATLYYKSVQSLLQVAIDFLGLFKPLPPLSPRPSGKLRILIFNWRDTKHVWAGGAETYLHELARRAVDSGHQVTIFCGNDRKSPVHDKVSGIRIVRRGGFYLVYFWAFLYYQFRLRGRFDVIIDSENGIPFFTPLYAKEKIFLLIHHVHQEVFRKSLPLPLAWFASALEKTLMPLVYKKAEVITVSPSSKADILAHRLTKQDPHIVYNGVDLKTCKPGKKSRTPMVLYLGRLTTVKSLNVLVNAARHVISQVPRVRFVIAGDGPARPALTRLVKQLGLGDKIEFTGRVDEKAKLKLYQQAWVFVNPSLIEGWGITTIEANACGTPVVASNVSGLRDAVHNPHSGYLVPYGHITGFSEAITGLLKSKQQRQKMSREAVAWAQRFDWDHSASLILDLLGKGVQQSPVKQVGEGTRNKRIFLKEWHRPIPRKAQNELHALKALQNVLPRGIRVPKLLRKDQNGDKLVLGQEYIEGGKLLADFRSASQIKVYRKVLVALSSLNLPPSVPLMYRPPSYLVISFPYILLRALMTHPWDSRLLLSTAVIYLQNFGKLFGGSLGFVHRDLNPGNLILKNKQIYIIDLEYAALSLKEYDYAGIWRSVIHNKALSQKFLALASSLLGSGSPAFARFRLLSIYYATLGLTDSRFEDSRVKDFVQMLKQARDL